MKDKIRFLATGDIHSDKGILENIKKYTNISEIDYILLTGDISDKNYDFKEIFSIFEGKPILMVPGNHETKKQLKIMESVYNVHLISKQEKKIHNDLVIFGPEAMNIGKLSKSEESIKKNLIERFNKIKETKTKIFMSHIPPASTILGNMNPFFPFIRGSYAVKEFLDNNNVELSLVGHIHETSGLEEIVNENLVINVGKTSKIIEFDLKTKKLSVLN